MKVSSDKLSINVPKTGASRIEFDFLNTGRNVQLLLPMTLTITCDGSCVKAPPLLPAFLDSNMVLQRAPEKANLWGSSATAGETVTVAMSGSAV